MISFLETCAEDFARNFPARLVLLVRLGKVAVLLTLVVHNIGAGAREEDILFRFTVIGHYRLPAAATSSPVVSH
jgi:hypothetical protein